MKAGKKVKGIKGLIVIFLSVGLSIGALGFFSSQTLSYASSTFSSDGFILTSELNGNMKDTVNAQYYFNGGMKYLSKTDETISFKNINGEKVSVSRDNFVHYMDTSMSSLSKSVLLDTDSMYKDQIVYYTVSQDSLIEKRNNGYAVNTGSDILTFKNFVWKISDEKYMVVSDKIKLVVDEDSTQSFDGFIQLEYIDEGVVYLVNQEGTYKTISSAAYLELENGIRVYIGSKNVSDSDGILMNLSQMLVSSSDEKSEGNPDTQYKNEKDVQPRITVEASDGTDGIDGVIGETGIKGEEGEDGKLGEAGEEGEEGDPGKAGTTGKAGEPGTPGNQGAPGKPGTAGEPGPSGTDDPSSQISYSEESLPIFYAVLDPTSYSVHADFNYEEGTCSVNIDDSYVSIIETATGNEVWRSDSNSLKGNFAQGYYIDCSTLKQNTNYTFAITASYTDNNEVVEDGAAPEVHKQLVYTKYFTTASLGVNLSVNYTGQNYICADLAITEETDIDSLVVKCFDANGNQVINDGRPVCGIIQLPENASATNYEAIAAIKQLADAKLDLGGYYRIPLSGREYDNPETRLSVGDHLTLMFSNLDPNTVYYIQISDVHVDETGLGGDISKNDLETILTNSFPAVKAITLKRQPSLGRPEVNISERLNSLIITPTDIFDPDKGLVAYIYEIYNGVSIEFDPATGETKFNEAPVYSTEFTTLREISVTIDGQTIKRESENPGGYYARIVGKFDNNDTIIKYPSPLSEKFTVGESVWPTIMNTIDYNTGSTVQGTLVIYDTYKTIQPDIYGNYGFRIAYKSTEVFDGKEQSGFIDISDDIIEAGRDFGIYEIPYFIPGLKSDSQYSFIVYAGSLVANNQSYRDVIVGTDSFKTSSYDPLKLTAESIPNDSYAFNYRLSFSAKNPAAEASRTVNEITRTVVPSRINESNNIVNSIAGDKYSLENLGDFSGKSLQGLLIELYSVKEDDTLGDHRFAGRYIFDENYLSSGNTYKFGTSTTSFYQNYYVSPNTLSQSSESALIINDAFFKDGQSSFNLNDLGVGKVAIKITAMDYCFGTGSPESKTIGDNNIIPLAEGESGAVTVQNITAMDRYVSSYFVVKLQSTLPHPDDLTASCKLINKSQAIGSNTHGLNSTYADANNNILTSGAVGGNDYSVQTKSRLDQLYDGTYVALNFSGYSDMIPHAESVSYSLLKYTGNTTERTDGYQTVYTSAALSINDSCPDWTFYFDVPGKNNLTVTRGDLFKVKTEFVLKDNRIYPTQITGFPELISQLNELPKKQAPELWVFEKDGIKEADSILKGSYYFDYYDPDNALISTSENQDKPDFYVLTDPNDKNTSQNSTINFYTNNSEMYGYDAAKDDHKLNPRFIISDVSLNAGNPNKPERLYAKYNLYSDTYYRGKSATDEDAANKKKNGDILTMLVDPGLINVSSSENIYILDEDFSTEHSDLSNQLFGQDGPFSGSAINPPSFADIGGNGSFTYTFYVLAKDSAGFGKLDLEFELTGNAYSTTPAVKIKDVNYSPNLYGTYDEYKLYELSAGVKATNLIGFSGKGEFSGTATLYYDTGKFGLDYVDYNTNTQYILQETNPVGIYEYTKDGKRETVIVADDTENFTLAAIRFGSTVNSSQRIKTVDLSGLSKTGYGAAIIVKSSGQSAPSGLSMVPRHVENATVWCYGNINYILPAVPFDVYPGLTTARIYYSVKEDNTLANTDTGNVFFRFGTAVDKEGHLTDLVTESSIYATPKTQVDDHFDITGLTQGKEYYCEVWAQMSGTDKPVMISKIATKFKTIKQVDARINTQSAIFTAYSDARDHKTVQFATHLSNVSITDIENNIIKNVQLYITNSSGTIVSDSKTLSASDLRDKLVMNPGDNNVGTVDISASECELSWSPAINHKLGDKTKYKLVCDINYGTVVDPKTSVSEEINPSAWKKDKSYQALNYSIARADKEHVNLTADFSAKDQYRVFKTEGSNLSVKFSLRDANGNPVDGFADIIQSVNYHTEDGTIDPISVGWNNVPGAQRYIVYSTIGADYDNDGDFETYTIQTGRISVPQTTDVMLAAVTLDPVTHRAALSGVNLSFVQKIKYILYINGDQKDAVELSGDDLNRRISKVSENYYYLNIPNMNVADNKYLLDVEVYDNASSDTFTDQQQGSYPENIQETGVASLFSKLTAFIASR